MYLSEPGLNTGHSFRRSSATLLATAGEHLVGLKRRTEVMFMILSIKNWSGEIFQREKRATGV